MEHSSLWYKVHPNITLITVLIILFAILFAIHIVIYFKTITHLYVIQMNNVFLVIKEISFLWFKGWNITKFCINAPLEAALGRSWPYWRPGRGRFIQEKHRRINNQLHAEICSLPLSTRNTTNHLCSHL